MPTVVLRALASLTLKERKFVESYCGEARGNATLAVKKAGFKGTDNTLQTLGSQVKRRTHVYAAIQAWLTAYAMGAAELTRLITDMAGINPGPFVQLTAEGGLQWHITADAWETYKHWVKAIEWDEKGKVRLILHDARSAQRDLAKILKLYSDAPQWTLHLHLQQLSDDEVLRRLEVARMAARSMAVLSPN